MKSSPSPKPFDQEPTNSPGTKKAETDLAPDTPEIKTNPAAEPTTLPQGPTSSDTPPAGRPPAPTPPDGMHAIAYSTPTAFISPAIERLDAYMERYAAGFVNILFSLLSIALCYLYLQIGKYHGLGRSIWLLLLLTLSILWLRVKKIDIPRVSCAYFGLLIPLSLMYALFDLDFLKALTSLLIPPVYAYAMYVAAGRRKKPVLDGGFFSDTFTALFRMPFSGALASSMVLGAGIRSIRRNKKPWQFLLGLLIMLPVLLLVFALLQYDAAFTALLPDISSFRFHFTAIVTRLFAAFFLSCLLFGLLYQLIYRPDAPVSAKRLPTISVSLALGGLLPLLLIYLLFFFSQFSYQISAFANRLPDFFSYADYARQGFSELCVVSAINAAVMTVLYSLIQKGDLSRRSFQVPMGLLSLFSLGLITISLRKMILYISQYHLTPNRLYSSWFMLFLALCFLGFLVKLRHRKFNFVKLFAAALAVMFLILCYGNSDGLIVSYNIRQFQAGQVDALDADTLEKLGAASTKPLLRLQETNPSPVVDEALRNRKTIEGRHTSLWEKNLTWLQSDRALKAYLQAHPDPMPTDNMAEK